MQKISKRSLLEKSCMYATHDQCVWVETNSRSRVRIQRISEQQTLTVLFTCITVHRSLKPLKNQNLIRCSWKCAVESILWASTGRNRAVQFVVILKPERFSFKPWITMGICVFGVMVFGKIGSVVNITQRDSNVLFYDMTHFSKNPHLKFSRVFLNYKLNRWHHSAWHPGNFLSAGKLSQSFLLLLRQRNGDKRKRLGLFCF